ncbi:hypothetical protein AE923_08945 [Xanthomonas arboricola]|uniref:hypothetical protein n=1 Tax=Xanthomonas arboricola TaxID=56448 RepID=UPI00069E263C|nr:hypothetical protein [Xanthomonas arboricola]KOB09330.1 hypothetical protein AE923_08945 [Xanthomonas arboricola]
MAFEYAVVSYIIVLIYALLSFGAALSVLLIGELPSTSLIRLSVPPFWYSLDTLSLCLISAAGGAVLANGLHHLSNRLEARVMKFSRGSMSAKGMRGM